MFCYPGIHKAEAEGSQVCNEVGLHDEKTNNVPIEMNIAILETRVHLLKFVSKL